MTIKDVWIAFYRTVLIVIAFAFLLILPDIVQHYTGSFKLSTATLFAIWVFYLMLFYGYMIKKVS